MSAPYDPDARYPDSRAQPSSDPRIAQIQSVSAESNTSSPDIDLSEPAAISNDERPGTRSLRAPSYRQTVLTRPGHCL